MKRRALAVLHRTGALALARKLQRGRSVILAYHGVLTAPDESRAYLDDNFPTADVFELQIDYLARHYHPIRLQDLIAYYEHGEPPPVGSVAVTFDDGFANNYSVAFPILQKYGVPFTVFLTTGMIGQRGAQLWTERVSRALYLTSRKSVEVEIGPRSFLFRMESGIERESASRVILSVLKRTPPEERDAVVTRIDQVCGRSELKGAELERYEFLSWPQVRAMAASGVEFGSHTVSHPILSTLDESRLVREILHSKIDIEAQLGQPCYAFAYPNGSFADFASRDKYALREAGYRCALALSGSLNGPTIDLFSLQRVNIGRQFDAPLFEATLCGLLYAARQVRKVVPDASVPATERIDRC